MRTLDPRMGVIEDADGPITGSAMVEYDFGLAPVPLEIRLAGRLAHAVRLLGNRLLQREQVPSEATALPLS